MGGDTAADNEPVPAAATRSRPNRTSSAMSTGRSTPTPWPSSTPGGGRPTISSVGQIYLLTNPLLTEPLQAEHVKPRLLGHFGTVPGLNLVYAHANRADPGAGPECDLRRRPRSRRTGPERVRVAGGHLLRAVQPHAAGRRGHGGVLQAVLLPRRGAEPLRARDTGVHPRGRRAGLLAAARLRGGVRQSRSHRVLRGRGRRGGDRAAGRQLARRQVLQSGSATGRYCRSSR